MRRWRIVFAAALAALILATAGCTDAPRSQDDMPPIVIVTAHTIDPKMVEPEIAEIEGKLCPKVTMPSASVSSAPGSQFPAELQGTLAQAGLRYVNTDGPTREETWAAKHCVILRLRANSLVTEVYVKPNTATTSGLAQGVTCKAASGLPVLTALKGFAIGLFAVAQGQRLYQYNPARRPTPPMTCEPQGL